MKVGGMSWDYIGGIQLSQALRILHRLYEADSQQKQFRSPSQLKGHKITWVHGASLINVPEQRKMRPYVQAHK